MTESLGFSPPMFHGRGIFQYNIGILPFRKPITTVVGKPIDVKQVDNPSDEEINELHNKYIKSLKELFEENNEKYGNKDLKLIIK
ncbi:unnamed protein product [Medioppia subpectinata]|uniref:diacylglycerol O-acyltransferase n=1 Tax=Medioppia subpectinata TaxID=1979941 RepID=A0A7R9QDI0_9ACAR|nr:unnamed protein product [Medioppia subpectinata]CAG2118807.1 unnamed protein product [Medioppia subpectinata]